MKPFPNTKKYLKKKRFFRCTDLYKRIWLNHLFALVLNANVKQWLGYKSKQSLSNQFLRMNQASYVIR